METCPLSVSQGGVPGHAVRNIPAVCMENCESLWDEALRSQRPDTDYYLNLDPQNSDEWSGDCDHTDTEIVFSHEAVQAIDITDHREYSIVSACGGAGVEGCGIELFEESYQFKCPANNSTPGKRIVEPEVVIPAEVT